MIAERTPTRDDEVHAAMEGSQLGSVDAVHVRPEVPVGTACEGVVALPVEEIDVGMVVMAEKEI